MKLDRRKKWWNLPRMMRAFNLCCCFFTLLVGSASAQVKPLLERDKWVFGDKAAWEWTGTGDSTVLSLKKQSDFKPKVRSPFNLAWFTGGAWESFTLTAEVKLDSFNQGNNDVCIAFGKAGETKFYYAHLGEKADAVHLQLHVVNDADRKAITTRGANTLPWKQDAWHRVKLVRDAADGTIKVWFDDTEVLAATDKALAKGSIGLGSFDDLGSFRNVMVTENR